MLLVKRLEFTRPSGEESYWVYPNPSSGCDSIIGHVGYLTDSVELRLPTSLSCLCDLGPAFQDIWSVGTERVARL